MISFDSRVAFGAHRPWESDIAAAERARSAGMRAELDRLELFRGVTISGEAWRPIPFDAYRFVALIGRDLVADLIALGEADWAANRTVIHQVMADKGVSVLFIDTIDEPGGVRCVALDAAMCIGIRAGVVALDISGPMAKLISPPVTAEAGEPMPVPEWSAERNFG